MPPDSAPHVLMFVPDLIFATKIRSTAAELGVRIASIADAAAVSATLAAGAPQLLIVDLSLGEEALAAIRAAADQASRPSILAFVSHVETQLADDARAAGADHVLPRSRFAAELPRILQGAASGTE